MSDPRRSCSRRTFLGRLAWGTALFTTPGLFAEELLRTPRTTEGPFYPDKLPLDTDNDLLILNDKLTPAVGEVTHLTGRVLDVKGNPLRNHLVEIWQADAHGAYLHSESDNGDRRDENFQGFGRFLTGLDGEYYFRTIRPVPYTGRTPHIHLLVNQGDKRLLTTQLYDKARKAENDKDFLYRRLTDARDRAAVTVDFLPLDGSTAGELVARADIVVGRTPEDPDDDPGRRRRSRGRL